jgi:hypothetical protein
MAVITTLFRLPPQPISYFSRELDYLSASKYNTRRKAVASSSMQWCYSLFSSIEGAKTWADRGGLELKFEAIENMLSFCTFKISHVS